MAPYRNPSDGDRVQVADLQPTEYLQTAAKPVDQMVDQRKPALDSTYTQLASALGELNPAIHGLLQEQTREVAQKDVALGKSEALKSALSYKDAIEKGIIPPTASPWFVKGWKEQQGRNIGQSVELNALADYEKWEGKDANDPTQFQKWLSGYIQDKTKGITDPDILVGMSPELNVLQHNMMQQHAARTADRVYKEQVQGFQTELNLTIDRHYVDAMRTGKPISVEAIMAEVQGSEARQKFIGLKGQDINKAMVDAITTKAIETQNPSIMGILKASRLDGTPGAGMTSYGREKIVHAEQTIFSRQLQAENLMETRRMRAEREAAKVFTGKIVEMVSKGEYPDEATLSAAQKVLPDIRLHAMTWRNQMENAQFEPVRFYKATESLWNGTAKDPTAVANEALLSGAVPRSHAMQVFEQVSRISKGQHVLQNTSAQQVFHSMANLQSNIAILRDYPALLRSQQQFSEELLKWNEANPKASDLEIAKKVRELSAELDVYHDGTFGAGIRETDKDTAKSLERPSAPQNSGAIDWRTSPVYKDSATLMGEFSEWQKTGHPLAPFAAKLRELGLTTKDARSFIEAQQKLLGVGARQ